MWLEDACIAKNEYWLCAQKKSINALGQALVIPHYVL